MGHLNARVDNAHLGEEHVVKLLKKNNIQRQTRWAIGIYSCNNAFNMILKFCIHFQTDFYINKTCIFQLALLHLQSCPIQISQCLTTY